MTGPFTVDREVSGADLTITVTMDAAIDRIIDLLTDHNGIQYHVALLSDLPATSLHHQIARTTLRNHPALRAAVSERLTEDQADRLRDEVDEAAAVRYCTVGRCPNYAVDLDRCGAHLDGAA